MISIIVPMYNGVPYITRCINSILGQTYQEIEIIIVNDGSSDSSGDIIRKLAEKHHKIQVINQLNQGVSVARNNGLALAKGEYITFIDADDWIQPSMLQVMIEAIEKTKAKMAICDYLTCDNYKNSVISIHFPEKIMETVLDRESYITDSLLNSDTRCWGKLYRRELIGELRFRDNITIGEDLLFLIDILPNLSKIVTIDKKAYCYYNNEQGAMLTEFKSSYMDQIYCWKFAKQGLLENNQIEHKDKMKIEIATKVDSIILISIMLVVGKFALLTSKEQLIKASFLKECHEEIRTYYNSSLANKQLTLGYRIKIAIFRKKPKLYLKLYRIWKR